MELKSVESVMKSKPHQIFNLKDLWFELRNESEDSEHCRKWQIFWFQMKNQIEVLLEQNKIEHLGNETFKWILT